MVKETLEQFNILQGLDSRIHEIEETLAKIPGMLQDSLALAEKALKEKAQAEVEYEKNKAERLSLEGSLADMKNLLASAQKKLTSVSNNKEYEAALRELDVLKKNSAEAETKIKVLADRMSEIEIEIKTKQEDSLVKEQAYNSEKKQKEFENSALFEELGTLKAKRSEFAATMKNYILSKYERIRSARANLAIVPLSGEICTGCNMKIPPQMAVEVKKEKDLLQCPHCQRFLYQPQSIESKE
jgi:predicted  nucleic acid-binding Zn-ribbon protein